MACAWLAGVLCAVATVGAQTLVPTVPVRWQSHMSADTPVVGMLMPETTAAVAFETGGTVVDFAVDLGDQIRQGQVLARLHCPDRHAQLALRRAQLRQGEVQHAQSKRAQERATQLYETTGAITLEEKEEAEDAYNIASAALEVLRAQVTASDVALERCVIKAPWSGRVNGRFVDPGAVVATGVPVLELVSHSRKIVGAVPVSVAAHVQVGEQALARLGTETEMVTLERVGVQLSSTQRALRAEWSAPRTSTAIMGQGVVLMVATTPVHEPGFWLPSTALVEGTDGLWSVLVVNDSSQAEARPVAVLYSDNRRAYLAGGLLEGETVIARGAGLTVVAGQQVTVALASE